MSATFTLLDLEDMNDVITLTNALPSSVCDLAKHLFLRHCRRMPRGSPLTRHLSAGDAVVQLGQCAVASRADWAACLAARAVPGDLNPNPPGNGNGARFCVPEAAVLGAAQCNASAAAAGEGACQPNELCWVAHAGALTG